MAKTPQPSLALKAKDLRPSPGQEEPTVWVRRLLIKPTPQDPPIRDIPLERGLNIIWSPAENATDGAFGHAAGKTLFCRFLRYCLGEDNYADSEDTDAIKRRFPDGVLEAEVRVQGNTWLIRRPFNKKMDTAQIAESWTDFDGKKIAPGSFELFLAALQKSLGEETTKTLGKLGIEAPWHTVLARLTRDQECRMDGIYNWRQSATETRSGSPKSIELRRSTLRVMLNQSSDEFFEYREKLIKTEKKVNEVRSNLNRLENRIQATCAGLAEFLSLDIMEVNKSFAPSEADARTSHYGELRKLVQEKLRTLGPLTSSVEQAHIENQHADLAKAFAEKEQEIENLREQIKLTRERLNLHTQEQSEKQTRLQTAKHPTCPYDGAPLDVNRSQFVCPLPRLPDPAAALADFDKIEEQVDLIQAELTSYDQRLTALQGERAKLKAQKDAARHKIARSLIQQRNSEAASKKGWSNLARISELTELGREHDRVSSHLKEIQRQETQLRAQQTNPANRRPRLEISDRFDSLVKEVFAKEATGKVNLGQRGFDTNILWHGNSRRSVALHSLQVVLFDLAAMACSVEGHVRGPAFLVHDSPREGDLNPWMYERLFLATIRLWPDVSPPFQYIITTTTAPPESVRDRVKLALTGAGLENRLLKVDL